MLKVTGYVMLFAPVAVLAAITATVAKNGLGVLWKLCRVHGRLLSLGIDPAVGIVLIASASWSSGRASASCCG